jgi:CHAT domain-containing protein/Tfp pilus assembly protein PilF
MKVFYLFFALALSILHDTAEAKSVLLYNTHSITSPDSALAKQYIDTANILYHNSKYDSSLIYFDKAMIILYEAADWENYAYCLWSKAACYNELGEYYTALEYLDEAEKIFDDKLTKIHPLRVKVLSLYGESLRELGNYDLSREKLHEALSIYESIDNDLKNKFNLLIYKSKVYFSLGGIEFDESRYDTAQDYIKKAYDIAREVYGEQHIRLGDYFHALAIINSYNGDNDQALIYYEKAINLYMSNGIYNDMYLAMIYTNYSDVVSIQKDGEHSLIYLKRALSILIDNGAEYHDLTSAVYVKMGINYFNIEEYDKALEYTNKALEIDKHTYGSDEHSSVALCYSIIGNIYYMQSDYDKALLNLEKALSIQKKIFGEQHKDIGDSYRDIGDVKFAQNKYDEALELKYTALEILTNTFGRRNDNIASCYNDIGNIYFKQNKYSEALEAYQLAIMSNIPAFSNPDFRRNPDLNSVLDHYVLMKSLYYKTETFIELYGVENNSEYLELADETFTVCFDVINILRQKIILEGSKLAITAETNKVYSDAITNSIRLFEITGDVKYKRNAFTICEMNKSSVLLEAINQAEAKNFTGVPDSLLEKEKQLKLALVDYETQLQTELMKEEKIDSLKIKEVNDSLFFLNDEYLELIKSFERNFPKYYKIRYSKNTITPENVQEKLDDKTAVIEYFQGEDVIYVYCLSDNDYEVLELDIDSSFANTVDLFYKSIKKIDGRQYLKAASLLYYDLIAPIENLITNKSSLIIIPDGILYSIPFEALIKLPAENYNFSAQDYFINRYTISYNYSSSLYFTCSNSVVNRAKRYDFAGFAPVFDDKHEIAENFMNEISVYRSVNNEDYRFLKNDGQLNELPNSESEIEHIIDLFENKHKHAIGYLREQANENKFKSVIKDYKIIHLATHSFVNSDNPKFSGIILAQPEDSIFTEDGTVYSNEIYNLDLNADLVVLSSCESGIGKLVKGEGMMALTRGFLYAGADNIITSLWKVLDQSTSALMQKFYENVLNDMSYSHALREAKLSMINDSKTAFPLNWSGFVLIGQ